ncbi:Mobile element protein [Candidatus Synechococcus spongiarum]|uniref:Mobile element protein n=1 Tax=Candidatus Synechococcus spongiarum TaxID=431041 RepID=A0A161KJY0_9SYNE|nr:Mobile element protein [Candidatus Synechococcus spongiarum]
MQSPLANASHWSVPALADHTGIYKTTVHRWFQLLHLHPHRHRHFKISSDPFLTLWIRCMTLRVHT